VLLGFKRAVVQCGGFRGAFTRIPALRLRGVYALRHSYIRKPYRDIWHPVAESFLQVVYHRTFLFRPDGSLLYAMLPGDVAEATKEFRRLLAPTTAADTTFDVMAAALQAPGATAASVGGGSRALSRVGSSRSSHVGAGYWWLEGETLHCEVATGGRIVTRWVCEIAPPAEPCPALPHGRPPNSCLVVHSMLLLERGADAEAATPMTALRGEELQFHHIGGFGALGDW